jgi:hypothetical protein
MMICDHKTQEEYAVCNRCTAFATIAKGARVLLQARKALMDCLLESPNRMDEFQGKVQEAVRLLEKSVKFADDAKLWD